MYVTSDASIKEYFKYCEVIESIDFKFSSHYFIIVGDFNLYFFDWYNDQNIQGHTSGSVLYIFLHFETK